MTRSLYFLSVEKIVMLLLLTYPTLMLTVKGGMNAVFLLALLLALMVWLVRPLDMSKVVWQRDWTIYWLAMIAMSLAVLLSQIANQKYGAHPYDSASRYWLSILIFLLLQRIRPQVFMSLQFAFPLAAITGFLLTYDAHMLIDVGGRRGITTLDLIHFGDFELLLGMLSLLSIDKFSCDKWFWVGLKILGFVAGITASFASGSRGGWLAIPLLLGLLIYFNTGKKSLRLIGFSSLALLLILSWVLVGQSGVNQRLDALKNDAETYRYNRDTSTGIRWQLYKAAVDVFVRHPIFGVGPEGFATEMQPMMEAGKLTSEAASLGRGEVHSDILSKAAGMGIFGLVAMLSIYLVPIRFFWRATKLGSAQARRAGVLGIAFVSGFMVFGLTAETLNLTMFTAFYSFTVAVLLALCYNIHHGEQFTVNNKGDHV